MREIVSPLDGFASPFGPQRGFNPLRIFANDEPGVWFEANDSTTLFTDVAGTTPVTTPGDAVALQLDKSGRGNHRTQATTAARPLYALHPVGGVRNELEYTEEFDNAVWVKTGGATITANATTAPNGELTADRLNFGAGADQAFRIAQTAPETESGLTIQASFYAKEDLGSGEIIVLFSNSVDFARIVFDLAAGTSTYNDGALTISHDISLDEEGFYRCSASFTSAAGTPVISIRNNGAASSGDGVFLWGAQLEEGSTATNYQRVGSFLDVSEEGKARRGRIWYNGTSHFMQTGTITPGTDKVQVFAGVRPLQSAIRGVVAGYRIDGFQQVQLEAPGNFGNVSFNSSLGVVAPQINATYTAPNSFTITAIGDVDFQQLRLNGAVEATSTGATGTQNHPAAALEFGRRASNGDRYFNGYEDTSIIRFGPNLDAGTISKVESYVASKTPEGTI